eukprot:2250924-Pyramimonas_sp.AAC.1
MLSQSISTVSDSRDGTARHTLLVDPAPPRQRVEPNPNTPNPFWTPSRPPPDPLPHLALSGAGGGPFHLHRRRLLRLP